MCKVKPLSVVGLKAKFYQSQNVKQCSVSLQVSITKHSLKMSGSISDWFDYNQKNKPQSNALAGGIILMMVSGVQIGWIFNNQIFNLQWTFGHSTLEIIFTYVSFYIAVIVGLYAALIALDRLTKRNIYVSFTAFY